MYNSNARLRLILLSTETNNAVRLQGRKAPASHALSRASSADSGPNAADAGLLELKSAASTECFRSPCVRLGIRSLAGKTCSKANRLNKDNCLTQTPRHSIADLNPLSSA